MREQLAVLYRLQAMDITVSGIRGKLDAMDGAKSLRRKYGAAKAACEALQKELLANETNLKDLELKLKTIDDKRGGHEKRLYSGVIVNPKELAAIEKEIGILKAQQGELDVRVLELYDTVEKLNAGVDAGKEALLEAEKTARTAIKKEAAETTKLEAELNELMPRREKLAKQITDRVLLSRYDSARKRTGSTGIAKVVDGMCEGCHVSMTGFIMRNLYTDGELQTCENCSRVLMLEL